MNSQMKNLVSVDPNHELKAITNYVTNNWDGFDKIESEKFFAQIWGACLNKTEKIFNIYAFTDLFSQWVEQRSNYSNWKKAGTAISENDFKEQLNNDLVKELPMLIFFKISDLNRSYQKDWDYEEVAKSILFQTQKDFPEASKLKPKGWNKFKNNYTDYEGQAEFDSAKAKKEFGGMNSGGNGVSSFEVRVALPYVAYDDENQNRKPLEVLVQAMLTHAYVMSEKNNTALMLKELIKLKAKYDQPEYYKEPVTEINFDFQVPQNKDLFIMIHNSNPNVLKEYGDQKIESKRQKHLKKSVSHKR